MEWSVNLPRLGLVFKCFTSKSNSNLKVLVFTEGGKLDNPLRNPRCRVRTNNKLNRHEMVSTGIEPGPQRWESSSYPDCATRAPRGGDIGCPRKNSWKYWLDTPPRIPGYIDSFLAQNLGPEISFSFFPLPGPWRISPLMSSIPENCTHKIS